MDHFQSVSGMVCVELTGADTAGSLRRISQSGISLHRLQTVDELTVQFHIFRKDYGNLERLCAKYGDRIRLLTKEGIFWKLKMLLNRPVLIFCLLLLLVLMIWIPTRVFFVSVEGNGQIPAKLIVEAAAESGIGFGASRREVRSEKMKNLLLSKLPQLQWAGVNTYGCRAVITVRERAGETQAEATQTPGSIVASRDGVISSCTVTEGTGLCAVGESVREGQVLISGVEDHGLLLRAVRAEGEVIAWTRHNLTAMTPSGGLKRGAIGSERTEFSLCIGKKRINFYKGSGICDASCVKMYSEYVLTLPGGYELPVVLIRETVTSYDLSETGADETAASAMLRKFAGTYLEEQMIAGKIEQRSETISVTEDVISMTGEYACTEMIGRRRQEQIGEDHGKTD